MLFVLAVHCCGNANERTEERPGMSADDRSALCKQCLLFSDVASINQPALKVSRTRKGKMSPAERLQTERTMASAPRYLSAAPVRALPPPTRH